MTLELLKVGENGQMEFDFESLEAMTSSAFAKEIKFFTEDCEIKKSKVNNRERAVTVLIYVIGKEGGRLVSQYIFFKKSGHFEREFLLTHSDIDDLHAWIGGDLI